MIRRGIRLLAALGAVFLLAGVARAQAPQVLVPGDAQLVIMIKTTLIAFNHANATGNYAVLRELASPSFRQANTPARLGEIFQKQRNRNIDLSPVVVLQPKLLGPARIDERGLLRLEGFFPSQPEQVHFTLAFEVVGDKWQLFALGVHTAPPKSAVSGAGALANMESQGALGGATVRAKASQR